MANSGYVLAGFETLATIVDNFMLGKRGRWNNNFTRPQMSEFLSQACAGYLHSFGQNFANKKKYHKYNQTEADMYQKCRDMGIFDGCDFIADSGGFQISIGRLSRRESMLLMTMYYEWLEQYHHVLQKAFILDIPPGPGCEIFHSFDDVYKLNLESYQRAQNLNDELRKKIIYIHHFRTPKLWEIYTKIMRENQMFPSFEYHGTGGIVANMSSDMMIPVIIYVLPIIPLLNECKKYGRNYLNFHILGGANFRDMFFYEMFKMVVKQKHNIDLNITYDSSGIYKQVMHARYIHVPDEHGFIRKMNIKSDNLKNRFYDKVDLVNNTWESNTVEDQFQILLNQCAVSHNFKPISVDGVYDDETKTFHEDVKTYSLLYTLGRYSEIEDQMRELAEDAFPYYDQGDLETFYIKCLNVTRIINQGKLTKKQKTKAHSIARSLDMLVHLDEDYCEFLINKFLAKDEFFELDEKQRALKI
jgi:hypothetical protein